MSQVAPASGLPADTRLIGREVSLLDFNERVLATAELETVPLLERLKFVALSSQNLDEIFQIRVAALMHQRAAGLSVVGPEGLGPRDTLRVIRSRVEQIGLRRTRLFHEVLQPALDKAGIRITSWDELEPGDRLHLREVFEREIFPVLTPLAVDPAHPFPYISDLSLNLAVVVRAPRGARDEFARVKVPPLLPRFVAMPDEERFVPLEQVIAAHLPILFPGMEIVAHHPFRVTRNADLALEEEEAEDLLEAIETELRRRRRFARVVRLEVDSRITDDVLELLLRELELSAEDVYRVHGLLDLGGLWQLHSLDRPEHMERAWTPTTQPALAPPDDPPDLFGVLRARDVLVHHPYDSFTTSVGEFLEQAALDPGVLAIKQTLYRTSGPESSTVNALIRAAESGKQVVAVIELKARFDEQANIAWARVLEEAGVHVVYGLVGLKAHAKLCLVVRNEPTGLRRYAHVGTGNYNPSTARSYEDLGLLTADPDLCADVADLFNYVTGYSRQTTFRRVLVAPINLRASLLEMIGEESRPDGRIVMKVNNLGDPEIIGELYGASAAGASIDLIVRGACCLRPGVPGLSENIRVRSIIGRYLEHSRIFCFGDEARGRQYLIGSADLMPRNLDRRFEAVVPVTDKRLRSRLREILDVNLADDVLAWELGPDGAWQRVPTSRGVSTQARLQELALARAQRGSLATDA